MESKEMAAGARRGQVVVTVRRDGGAGTPSSTDVLVVPHGRSFVVGRSPRCGLVVVGKEVSRRHLSIEPAPDGGWQAVDLSSNGTYLDGRRMHRVTLHGEQHFRLGALTGPVVVVTATAVGAAVPRQPAAPQVSGAGAEPDHFDRSTLLPGHSQKIGPLPPPPGPHRETSGPGQPRLHRLPLGRVSLGRALSNDIVVSDLQASRQHAELLVGRGGAQIADLGSANGTFVNGHRVTRAALGDGDVVSIGYHTFRFVAEDPSTGTRTLLERVDTGDVVFEVDGLAVERDGHRLLDDVSFTLPARSLLAVVGPSGAGKSTMLGALTGFSPATFGSVRYAGRDLYAEYEQLRRRIGFVPQDDILHTSLTARQALEYGARLRFPADTTAAERAARVGEVLRELGLTSWPGEGGVTAGGDLADRKVSTLSGGQRKRTSVALELLTRPSLLYLDEPTSGLDPGMDKEVMESLRRLANDGRTVVVVTHSVAQLQLCDYLLVLAKGGRTAYFGPPEDALAFLGADSWADAFRMLGSTEDAQALADCYRASPLPVAHTDRAGLTAPRPQELPRIRQQPVLPQLVTLARRYLRVIASDRAYLRLLLAYPIVLGLIPQAIRGPFGFSPAPDGKANMDASRGLLVLVLMACFMGASNAVRELVKEREIYRRERAIGLSTAAYLGSKIAVLTLVTAAQSALLTAIGMAGRWPSPGILHARTAWAELIVAVAATAVASAMIGLVVSALVDNADKTMPPLVVFVMAQLVFSGALLQLSGSRGLEQVAWLFPSRFGFAAAAAVSDLNTLQRAGTPISPGVRVDPLWRHTAAVYGMDLAVLVVFVFVSVVIAGLLLRRLDPQRGRRRRVPGPSRAGRKKP